MRGWPGLGLPDVITGYGSSQEVLNEKAALFLGCDSSRVHLLNGASQAYPVLRHLYRGRRVAIPQPTFGEYPRSFPQASHYRDSPGADVQLPELYSRQTDLLVIVNPNNPSGHTMPTESIYDLAARTPETMFLIDESFLAFSGQPSMISFLEQAPLDNVVVLTSLGKAFGVPGLRLGYLYSSNADIHHGFHEFGAIWGVNALAEFFLELTIKFRKDLEQSIALTVAERSRMRDRLAENPLVCRVHDSGGNFLLVQLRGEEPDAAARLRQELLAASRIEVKDVSGKFPDNLPRLRLAVRTRADNDRLIRALQSVSAAALI